MSRELEAEREMFSRALHNAVYWQNRCVELKQIIEMFCLDAEAAQPSKPLTDAEIERIHDRYGGNMMNCARAIERAHGIKEK